MTTETNGSGGSSVETDLVLLNQVASDVDLDFDRAYRRFVGCES